MIIILIMLMILIGGWDPAWDIPKKMFILKPHKGHLRDRNRDER